MAKRPVPKGYRRVTPYLVVPGVARLIEFLQKAFGAKEIHPRMTGPSGAVMHAEIKIGDSVLMMGEPVGQYQAMPSGFYLYVKDVDRVYKRALQAGATSFSEPKDQFYGDRNASVVDPSGNRWSIATQIEDVSPEEIARRAAAMQQPAAQ
jgi:PhnB protein